jgi:hypothetical protein
MLRALFLAILIVGFPPLAQEAWAIDLTDRLELIGNKASESGQRGHSLNVWDLQSYQGKIFLGMGSTAANTGPIPVWSFDHASDSWSDGPEIVLAQEAIELFRIIDDHLYIPAADPKPPASDTSKFYRRRPDGQWAHYTSTRGLRMAHVRDLAQADGLLIGVGNSRSPHRLLRAGPGSVTVPLSSLDQHAEGGELLEFRSAITLMPPTATEGLVDPDTSQRNRIGNWLFSAFRLHDGLYASTRWLSWAPDLPEPVGVHAQRLEHPPSVPPFPAVLRWDSSLSQWVAPLPGSMHRLVPARPDRNVQRTLRPHKPALFGALWFAPLRSYSLQRSDYLDGYGQSEGFVVKPPNGPGRLVRLPDPDALGEAVLVDNDRLLVLANTRLEQGSYRVTVYTLDLREARLERLDPDQGLQIDAWTQQFWFRSPNPARSFARIENSWYFGLGLASGEPEASAGSLLRVRASIH